MRGVRGTTHRLQAIRPLTRLAVRAFRREVIARISPPFLYLTLLVASLKSRWCPDSYQDGSAPIPNETINFSHFVSP